MIKENPNEIISSRLKKSGMNNNNLKGYKYLSWLLHPGSSLSKKHFSTQLWKSHNPKSNNTKDLKNPQSHSKCLSSTIIQCKMSCLAIFSKYHSHAKLSDTHNLQGALTTAKSLILKINSSTQKFPYKYLSPRGPPFELLTLIAQFSLEITQSAREISGCLKRVSDCRYPFL
jgi:hypothetical protein